TGEDKCCVFVCVCVCVQEGVKTENNDHINLKVAGQDGSVVQFKIKRHTPLSKLMKAYCERQGLTMRQIRFRFDGQPINETDTPAQVFVEAYIFFVYCQLTYGFLHSF
uniref:Ubiquitin-like domain-containing protein n=1 Tax=Astyanax mexicanus TaxID=7994 RepID=A0A8B9HB48_ASTMX